MMTNQEAKLAETLKIWADHIQARRSSGMTVGAWCKSKGIHVHTYYYRQKQVRKAACKEVEQQERKTPVFAEIKPMEQRRVLSCSPSNIAVTLSIGSNLMAVHNGADRDTVSAVLKMLSTL